MAPIIWIINLILQRCHVHEGFPSATESNPLTASINHSRKHTLLTQPAHIWQKAATFWYNSIILYTAVCLCGFGENIISKIMITKKKRKKNPFSSLQHPSNLGRQIFMSQRLILRILHRAVLELFFLIFLLYLSEDFLPILYQ